MSRDAQPTTPRRPRRRTEHEAFPRECRLRAHYIRGLMAELGIKQSELGRELGCVQSHISNVVTGRRESRRIRHHIADRLGVDSRELWALVNYTPRARAMEITTERGAEISDPSAGGDRPLTPEELAAVRDVTERIAERAVRTDPALSRRRRVSRG